ncbi:hypothetical protein D3C81_205780 [compost metagenome]
MKSRLDNPVFFNNLVQLAHEVDGLNYTLHHPIDRDNKSIIQTRTENTDEQLQKLAIMLGLTDAIDSVLNERTRQDAKWGEQNHEPMSWMGILGEEFGELCEAVNETHFNNGPEARKKGGYLNMRAEAVQVAAVAISFIEALDRRYSEN